MGFRQYGLTRGRAMMSDEHCCWLCSSTPEPGSFTAVSCGCTCPVMDNGHGRGIPWPRDDDLDPGEHPAYYVNEQCPLHREGLA